MCILVSLGIWDKSCLWVVLPGRMGLWLAEWAWAVSNRGGLQWKPSNCYRLSKGERPLSLDCSKCIWERCSFHFCFDWGEISVCLLLWWNAVLLISYRDQSGTDIVLWSPLWIQEIKAFYMRENADGKTVAAMDLLVPRVINTSPFFSSFCIVWKGEFQLLSIRWSLKVALIQSMRRSEHNLLTLCL